MQREIEFRGKRVDIGEWVYGSLIKCGITGKHYIFPIGNDANESEKIGEDGCLRLVTYEVNDETLGQYTGLKDKNDKKIYEGDILRDSLGWVFTVEWDSENARFIGHHSKPRGETYICYVGREPKAEIIGNIYENPELLQEVE